MGIFSTKKKAVVDTTVMRVIDDDLISSPLQKAVLTAIIGDTDVSHGVIDAALNGSFRNFERMYRWAAEPGNYHWGLPNAKVQTSSDGFGVAVDLLEALHGGPIQVDYMHYRPINNIHEGYRYARDTWGWNPETNELELVTAYFGGQIPIYMEKLTAYHKTNTVDNEYAPEGSTLGSWKDVSSAGYTPERAARELASNLQGLVLDQDIVMGPGETESVVLHYVWIDGNGELQRGSYLLDLSGYDPDQEYYQARYTYNDTLFFWTYDPTTNAVPGLTDIFASSYIDPGTYFPFVMFRREDENRTANAVMNTQEFLSTKKLLDFLGIDFKEMGDSIHENPDINDIDQAVMMLGCPITTADPIQIEYLCAWFADLYGKLPDPAKDDGNRQLSNYYKALKNKTPDESYVVAIEDADFRLLLSFDYITKRFRSGNFGAEFANDLKSESSILYLTPDLSLPNVKNRKVRRLRRRITATIYEEIIVANPQIRYDIYKNKSAVGSAEDDILLLPLDYNIAKSMPVFKREQLYSASLHFVFNSRVIEKTKWYQTGVFKAVLVIAAVVIAVYTGQYQAVGAALAASGVTAAALVLLTLLVQSFLVGLVVTFALTELAKVLGLEATLLLAAIVAAVAIYNGQVAAADRLITSAKPDTLLKVSLGLVDAAQAPVQEEMNELMKDYEKFQETSAIKTEELEKAKDLMGTRYLLDPFMFVAQVPMFIPNESPELYFARTAHAGNIGTRSYELVQNFVDISLKLPTLEDIAGGQTE